MEIRIVPMSGDDQEFIGKTIEEIQNDYFLKDLIRVNKGWYYYAERGLVAEQGDILLFQMNNSIIAAAKLDNIVKFIKKTVDGCNGAYVVDCKTIKVFEPITKDELKEIIPKFEKFSQTKYAFQDNEIDIAALNRRINEGN